MITTQAERNQTAKIMRQMRKLLNHGRSELDCSCSNCKYLSQEEKEAWNYAKELMRWVVIFGAILLAGCFLTDKAHAYTDEEAIKSVIGEAENQGYKGMLAVSCAIRNKGNLKGVYGLHNPRVTHHKYSEAIYLKAQMAWIDSKTRDITHGANHWENVNAFGTPCWAKKCIETFRFKDHVFFKEIV